jgi:hypothetical protein
MITLTILVILFALAFAPSARRGVFGTLSRVFSILANVLFLGWLMGRLQPRRRWYIGLYPATRLALLMAACCVSYPWSGCGCGSG